MVLVHHRQARVAAGDDLLGLDPQQLGEDLAQLGAALEAAVVAHVDAGRGPWSTSGRGAGRSDEVELRCRRLAPRQVELEPARLQRRVG